MNAEDIVGLWLERKNARGPVLARMAEIRDIYNADIVLPLPEIDRGERPAVANLLQLGIDQTGRRIASTMPDVAFPALRPGVKTHEDAARDRKAVVAYWADENRLRAKLRRRARWLIGYASAPVILRPDPRKRCPRWDIRDPLTSFPAPSQDPDELVPTDAIFSFKRSLGWLRREYPDVIGRLATRPTASANSEYDLLEYTDANETVLVVVGDRRSEYDPEPDGHQAAVELLRVPNRARRPLVVTPGRITLDRPAGQFDGIVGVYQAQAKLMALETIAIQRGIFGDTWLIGRMNEVPKIIQEADGIRGKVGMVTGGDLQEFRPQPDFAGLQGIDRLERVQRISGGIPAEFGGESTSNVRTGRRGDAILSAAVDFPVQEAQEMFALAMREEIKTAIAIDKTYFAHEPKTFFAFSGPGPGPRTYTPAKLWSTDEVYVSYAYAGADANNLIIGVGQRVGMGTMSKATAMRLDPMVDDPEAEHDATVAEGLEAAMLNAIQTLAAQGALPPSDVARIMDLVRSDRMELAAAVETVQREAQERQARTSSPDAPETQPGIAMPGAGAETQTIPEPQPSMRNLASLLTSLRRPQMRLATERNADA